MEQRRFKRIPLILDAKIVSQNGSFEGFTENASVEGFKYLIRSLVSKATDFVIGDTIELVFKLPDGDSLDLTCEIMWVSESSASNERISLGLKIIDPPQKYREFLEKCPYFESY
jgi:hypothetical protein